MYEKITNQEACTNHSGGNGGADSCKRKGQALGQKSTKVERVEAKKVEVVDTTGAGDTFNGALAVALSEGCELVEAVRFANDAAALSVGKVGAQSGMPMKAELEQFRSERR
ncbi:hypothetical protein AB990_02890 [Alkalihalobacillus pseudalcaliphilus]|nr:PfkB family carbohydrate kinase [Alkalihalobacillus pseudalcaliphilus]KMK77439.1 hypothetical protein AB990_02890 [Alkalihalobacillus pseudalcaliphilus]